MVKVFGGSGEFVSFDVEGFLGRLSRSWKERYFCFKGMSGLVFTMQICH